MVATQSLKFSNIHQGHIYTYNHSGLIMIKELWVKTPSLFQIKGLIQTEMNGVIPIQEHEIWVPHLNQYICFLFEKMNKVL